MQITRYDKQTPPPQAITNQIPSFFQENYPPKDPDDEEKSTEIIQRDTPEKIQDLINQGHIFFIATDTNNQVTGFLECEERDHMDQETPYALAMLTWMMVRQNHREKGLSSRLHDHFTNEAEQIAQKYQERGARKVDIQFNTHSTNTIARTIYNQWGYTEFHKRRRADGSSQVYFYKRLRALTAT